MEETKRRRYIIRAVLEGEVDVQEAPGPAPIDWDKDPLEGIEWMDNKNYNSSGQLYNATNEHCTQKFSVQDCVYLLSATGSKYEAIHAWDENDNYLGNVQAKGLYQLDSRYKYALKAYQTSDFDPANISLMPKNNTETAADEIKINLNEHIGEFNIVSGYFELNIGTALTSQGIDLLNFNDKIKSCNYMAHLSLANHMVFSRYPFVRLSFYNLTTLQFQIQDVSMNIESLEAYLADHQVSIILNGD